MTDATAPLTSEIPITSNGTPNDAAEDDTFERDLKKMLQDGPNLNNSSAVQGGSGTTPTTVAPTPFSGSMANAVSKIESIKNWSLKQIKCTRQILSERFGRGSRTVDLQLEAQIEVLRDTQRKYQQILRLARGMASHFYNVVQTQRALGDTFSDLAQKSPELQEEFTYNAETQKALCKNGETLLGAINFFTSNVNTLVNKTMEDTLLTIRQYEQARVEYDAYRTDLEQLVIIPSCCRAHKDKFDRLRGDVAVKLKFLEENKVKVMHKQLLLFHNAISAYFAGNQTALEATLKQFNIKLKSPGEENPSWLEE
uniref:AH domain-containing protein n=1 Tax=Branchiostoma floridae TaxID=7739 RepID=C3YS87_BRAFL|eukprot:XP_002600980.1 hypothetical protein BRAFLDRAFT_79183 [Branchiostoma floridae]